MQRAIGAPTHRYVSARADNGSYGHAVARGDLHDRARLQSTSEDVVGRRDPARRHHGRRRGRARRLLGRDGRDHGGLRARATAPRAARRRSVRARGDRGAARRARGQHRREDGARRRAARLVGKRVGQPIWRLLGRDDGDARRRPRTRSASTRVEGTADRTRRAQPATSVLKIKVGGAGRPRAPARRSARALDRAAAHRRQRGLDARDGPRADARRSSSSASSSSSSRSRPTTSTASTRCASCAERHPGRDRRGLPGPRPRRADRHLRRRHQHQAREVRRHPRGGAHGRTRRARSGCGVMLGCMIEVRARHRAGGRSSRSLVRLRRPRRPPADLGRAVRAGSASRTGASCSRDAPGLGVEPLA